MGAERVGGDGMDSESLFTPQQPRLSGKRHQNLTNSPKAALRSREPSPKYVPHEPVRGAVRPIKAGLSTEDIRRSKAELNATESSHSERTIQVPVYNAPGGLSYGAYEMLKQSSVAERKGKEVEPAAAPSVKPQLPPEEERQVEGERMDSPEVRELKEQIVLLEENLGVQIKVCVLLRPSLNDHLASFPYWILLSYDSVLLVDLLGERRSEETAGCLCWG